MPQFEISRPAAEPVFVRARSAEDAVRRHLDATADSDRQPGAPLTGVDPGGVALAAAEPGSGWQAVTLDGEPWGQVRPRDRMRFRRD